MTPAKRPRDVRRMWAADDPQLSSMWLQPKRYGPVQYPVAVVDLRPEAQERLERRLVNAIGAWESNKYGQRTSLGNRASQARAVLAALFGAKKGRK